MAAEPSLITRIVVGKTVGFIIGLLGLLFMPHFLPDIGWMPRLGVLFWYTTLGAIIALAGVMNYHPLLKMPMPWWVLSPALGAWMNFVLALFAYDLMGEFIAAAFGTDGAMSSPFWFVAEGAIVGLIIGYFATRFGGSGPATVAQD